MTLIMEHHTAFTIYKAVDVTTPLGYVMCCNAEIIDLVEIQYFISAGGSTDVPFFTWRLTNAYVTEVRQIPARELGGAFEEQFDLLEAWSFSYQAIEWEHFAHTAPIGPKEMPAEIQSDSWGA